MFDRMGFRLVAGLFLVLALIAGAAAIGYLAYTAGLAQGAAADSAQGAPAAGLPAKGIRFDICAAESRVRRPDPPDNGTIRP